MAASGVLQGEEDTELTHPNQSIAMAFPRTLAVFLCVLLASLAFVAPDVLAARDLAQASGRMYRFSVLFGFIYPAGSSI
jgi:hypothetical protein